MAVEIKDLPNELSGSNVHDDDLLAIYDISAGTNNTKKIKRSSLLNGVARDGGSHDFETSNIQQLTAGVVSLTFNSGGTITNVVMHTANVAPSNILTGASQTVTVAVGNIFTTDFLNWSFTGALPNGLICQAWISDADEVSFKFYNATGSTITGATYTARIMVFSES